MAIDHLFEVQLAPELLSFFFPLLQQGVEVEVETGCSLKQLLIEQFGISADYIASRITTLFLNSRAVDDAATALVHDGAVLALSGAMPGLVGATMRSGGFYAAMRGAMTYQNEAEAARPPAGADPAQALQPAPRGTGAAGSGAGRGAERSAPAGVSRRAPRRVPLPRLLARWPAAGARPPAPSTGAAGG